MGDATSSRQGVRKAAYVRPMRPAPGALGLVIVLVALLSGNAAGFTLVPPDPKSTAALAGARVPLPEASIARVDAQFGDYPAGFDCRSRTLYLPAAAPPELVLHETGHVFDCVSMTEADRAAFRMIMGYRPAWGIAAERFADAFSVCALGPPKLSAVTGGTAVARSFSPYGYRPRKTQHRRVCALIRTIGNRPAPAV